MYFETMVRNCSSALTMSSDRIALVSPWTKALRKRSMFWPYTTTSKVVASVQSALLCAMQMRWAATALSQSALNSAQVFGRPLMPACSIALVEAQIQLMRWMFIGAATQWPVGFITGSSSGATTLSQPSLLARSSRLAVMPVEFHSAISGPLSCTAGDDVGAQLGKRIGGMPRDRGLLPFSPGGGEHLAELGDRRRVRAFGPLMQHVGLGFGHCRSCRKDAGHGCRKRRLDREHRFSPMSK